ncbi:MAG: hypothetical protein V1907_02020 [Candidatus Kerfeldbacteria bacterium]
MALVQKRDTRKNVVYLALLGVAVAGGIVALFFFKPKGSTVDTTNTSYVKGRDQPTYTTFGEDLYESEQYKQLRDYLEGSTPIQPTNANTSQGNPNPFRSQ